MGTKVLLPNGTMLSEISSVFFRADSFYLSSNVDPPPFSILISLYFVLPHARQEKGGSKLVQDKAVDKSIY